MNNSRFLCALFVCMLFLNVKMVYAGTLYLTEDYNPNGLYVIDTNTGAATLSGSGITGNNSSTFGLAPSNDPDKLFSGRFTTGYETTVINADGSGVAVIGTGGFAVEGLAYDSLNDVLYGTWNNAFWTIDPTTGIIINTLPDVPTDNENLTFAHGGVYAAGSIKYVNSEKFIPLYFYDPSIGTSGQWLLLGDIPNPNPGGHNYFITGLAYDPINDFIYTVGQGDYLGPGIGWNLRLGIIDPQALIINLIGDTGINYNSAGLAYVSAIPIPPAHWLFCSGLLGLVGLAKKKVT